MPESPDQVTDLLMAWSAGDESALGRLVPIVEAELHRLARHYMRRERGGQTLQTTALVDEAYMRLAGARAVRWQDRAHFFAVAARMMRRILVDAARARRNRKRGGGAVRVSLSKVALASPERGPDLLALDEALERLAALNERQSRVVELRYFGGLTEEETAEVLGVTARTVQHDWRLARAWLCRTLRGTGAEDSDDAGAAGADRPTS